MFRGLGTIHLLLLHSVLFLTPRSLLGRQPRGDTVGAATWAVTAVHPGGGPLPRPSASGEPVLPMPVPSPGPGGCKRPAPMRRHIPGPPARCASRGASSCGVSPPAQQPKRGSRCRATAQPPARYGRTKNQGGHGDL